MCWLSYIFKHPVLKMWFTVHTVDCEGKWQKDLISISPRTWKESYRASCFPDSNIYVLFLFARLTGRQPRNLQRDIKLWGTLPKQSLTGWNEGKFLLMGGGGWGIILGISSTWTSSSKYSLILHTSSALNTNIHYTYILTRFSYKEPHQLLFTALTCVMISEWQEFILAYIIYREDLPSSALLYYHALCSLWEARYE